MPTFSDLSLDLPFGGRYELLSVGSDSSSFVVNTGLFIDAPRAPRITKITTPSDVSSSSFVLSVSGEYLPSGETFTVTLTSGHTFEISFSSDMSGTSSAIPIGGSEDVEYDSSYTIQSIIRKLNENENEHILFPSTPFKTPLGPTLSFVSCVFHSSNPNILNLTLTSARMPSEDFTLTLKTTELPVETVHLVVSSAVVSTGFILVEVYKKTKTLKYVAKYSIAGMKSSSVTAVVLASPFRTPCNKPKLPLH
ncbi:hypothetical protein BLNAU_14726 [Blattamonas nauphoetae]|uniref:Uncharacterized protein n=1 Tax=Blattamonas nauphoetae TaxID=2049346 RepID=A0ABQ9XFW6_9EUKA|nr:hypothetical protein BLNAU_14726 [Blattamonas nauphoetae]